MLRSNEDETWKEGLESKPIVEYELKMIWWIYDQKKNIPKITYFLHGIVSRYRTQDISLILWIYFIYLVPEFGFPYVWKCIGNLGIVILLQYGMNSMRPIDYDNSLHVYECTDPDTRGFPSVDSHMAILVVYPAFFADSATPLILMIMIVSVLLIGFSRVFVGARFPSQVVASWGTGLMGIFVGNFFHLTMESTKLHPSYNRILLTIVIIGVCFCFARWAERNESRLFSVQKQEYTRVLGNIIGTTEDVGSTPTSTGSNSTKRDSFYYLMQNVHDRRISKGQPASVVRFKNS